VREGASSSGTNASQGAATSKPATRLLRVGVKVRPIVASLKSCRTPRKAVGKLETKGYGRFFWLSLQQADMPQTRRVTSEADTLPLVPKPIERRRPSSDWIEVRTEDKTLVRGIVLLTIVVLERRAARRDQRRLLKVPPGPTTVLRSASNPCRPRAR
jgi:hypothetical protein